MAPIVSNAMPAGDLDIQRYVAPGEVASTVSAIDAKAIEHQNAFQPSLAQVSDKNKNNKWLKDLELNPAHIEIQPTTLASLQARDVQPDNEPNAINCNSFGIRGGHRCQIIGGGDIQSRLRKNHGQRQIPRPISKQDDEPKLSRRDKGFESHPCGEHDTDGRCAKIVSPHDREISQTVSDMAVAGDGDHKHHIPKPDSKQDGHKLTRRERNNKGFESYPCENHATGGGCAKIVSPRDTDISEIMSNVNTFANIAGVEGFDNTHHDLHKHREMKYASFLGEHESKEDMEAALDAYYRRVEAHKRARATATAVGISVTVVVCVFLLGLIFLYLRKRSKKLAAAKGRVAELELETRTKGDAAQGVQASNC